MLSSCKSDVESKAPGRYTGLRMERVRLTPPGEKRARGSRARLYIRWMPHLGAEAVALYELLRILPDLGDDDVEVGELAELLRSTPEGVEEALKILADAGFVTSRDGWLEVAEHPPSAKGRTRDARRVGYVRSILERWVERGVKSVEDVERFEQDRRLRLVEQSGAVKGGALRIQESGGGVSGGQDRQSAARRREGYEWLFGETE